MSQSADHAAAHRSGLRSSTDTSRLRRHSRWSPAPWIGRQTPHLRNALPEAATNAPRCLIDAESALRPQRHDLNTMDDPESLSMALPDGTKVSALLRVPEGARALYVFAHGAGAGMQHAGMSSLADALA